MGIFNNEYKIVVGVSTQKLFDNKYTEIRDAVIGAVLNNGNMVDNVKQVMGNGLAASVRKYNNITEKYYPAPSYVPTIDYNSYLNFGLVFPAEPITGSFEAPPMLTYAQTKYFFYDYKTLYDLINSGGTNRIEFNYYWCNRYHPLGYLTTEYMPNFMGWNELTKEVTQHPPEVTALGNVIKVEWHGNTKMSMTGPRVWLKVITTTGSLDYLYTPLNLNDWMGFDKSLLVFLYRENGFLKAKHFPISSLDRDLAEAILSDNYSKTARYITTSSIIKSKVPLKDDNNNAYQAGTIRALKALGIELNQITEAILSTEGGNDPSIIDDAFIGFGVNIRSNDKVLISYMFDFFNYVRQVIKIKTKADWDFFLANYSSAAQNYTLKDTYNNVAIRGGDNNSYGHTIRFTWMESTTVEEYIGKVGATTKEAIIRPYLDVAGNEVDDSSLILRRQITPTHIIRLEVRGLSYVAETYPNSYAYYRMSEYADDAKNHIYLPIVTGLIDQYGVFEKGTIFNEGLILTVFAKDVVKIPWYLGQQFLGLIKIVAIVIALVTFNPQGSGFVAILKELALEAIKQIVLAKLLGIAIKEVAELIGYDATAIIIALVAAYGVYEYTLTDNVWAEELLQLVQLAQNSFNNVVTDDMAKVTADSAYFNEKYQEALKAIEEVQSQFAPKIDEIVSRRFSFKFDPNETPEMFYNRTIHTGNIGVASLDSVSTFVRRKLTLPKNRDFSGD